jgi:hypothetical protein
MHDIDDIPLTSKDDRYLYALIDSFGKCWVIVDGGTQKVEGLPWLMRKGWRPIRETPFAVPGIAYILICLERV